MIKLSSFFSDYMVLQRDTEENTLWGYAKDEVFIQFKGEGAQSGEVILDGSFKVEEDGFFMAELPSHPAGGDYTVVIWDADGESSKIVLQHVTFGDVFVCGGQSNMELPIARTMERYADEIEATDNKNIRFFRVPEKFNFHHTEELIESGAWAYAKMPEIPADGSRDASRPGAAGDLPQGESQERHHLRGLRALGPRREARHSPLHPRTGAL